MSKQLGMTQEMLAERGDMTPQVVSYAEAGKRAMRPENLLKLASSLGGQRGLPPDRRHH